MADQSRLVAVVINTVDDSLAHGRESDGAGWQVSDLGSLRSPARPTPDPPDRAVIITSDHGHVLERDGEYVKAPDAGSARHRTGPGPTGAGEIELTGPRVGAAGQPDRRTLGPRAALPAAPGRLSRRRLAGRGDRPAAGFLLPNVNDVPVGWAPVAGGRPDWWEARPAAPAVQTAPAPAAPAARQRRRPPAQTGEGLFDVPEVTPAAAAAPTAGDGALVDALLDTELFKAQHGLTPRRVDLGKVEAAMRALVDAKGVLPLAVLAQRAGESPVRAAGFVTTLQRIFNVDNYPVLSLIDEGRTVRLELTLLREQFGLPGTRP